MPSRPSNREQTVTCSSTEFFHLDGGALSDDLPRLRREKIYRSAWRRSPSLVNPQ